MFTSKYSYSLKSIINKLEPYLTDSSQSDNVAELLYKRCKAFPVSFQIADLSLLDASCLSVKTGFKTSISKLNSAINNCKTTTKSPSTTTKHPSTTTKHPSTTTKSPSTTTKSPSTTTKRPSTTKRTGRNFTTLTHYMKYGDDIPILQDAASTDSKRYWMGSTENIKPNIDPRFNNFARF